MAQNKSFNLKMALKSRRGRDLITFCVFVFLAAVLWLVMTLNQPLKGNFDCPVQIVNTPVGLQPAVPVPEKINVTATANASQILKYIWGTAPSITLDYKKLARGGRIQLDPNAVKNIAAQDMVPGVRIEAVDPDSIMIQFKPM